MHVIIAGCGRVGAQAAGELARDGHSVVVIDRNPKAFRRLPKTYSGKSIAGLVYDKNVVEEAGITQADAFVAVTNGDNSNIVSARIAKEIYRVPIVVRRIYDPQRAEIYRRFGVTTFATAVWGANKVIELVTSRDLSREYTFGNDEVQMLVVGAPGHIVGKPVMDLNVPGEIQVAVIMRRGKPIIPISGTRVEERDQIHVIVHESSIDRFRKMMGLMS
jgi:trk system potassium uptake protein